MALPAPYLDDRRFQQLVDEAKRMVQVNCPEWTDHNVSDPGVTLIETFAYMVDQLIYRLNRVPERNFIKFLELIGVRLFPATSARVPVTCWLSAPMQLTVTVHEGTVVATSRTETEEAISFSTAKGLPIVPCAFARAGTHVEGGEVIDTTEVLAMHQGFSCFSSPPRPGDVLLVGLSEPVPSCAVRLRVSCTIEGVGVDPLDPPLEWQAWCGEAWGLCEVGLDDTGGLNRDGQVVLHVPAGHRASVIDGERAGWLRARVTPPVELQPFYSASPRVSAISAETIGGTVVAVNSQEVTGEVVGLSEGVAGQRFALAHRPVAAAEGPVYLEVAGGDGWQRWEEVQNFAESGPGDRHFVLDEVAGEVELGPAVREPDGSLRHYGAVPAKGVPIRVVSYRCGGGRRGNVAKGAITVLKTTVPFVGRVENRVAAAGGVDAENIEAAKVRGPILLRTRNRAVTSEDFEQLAREAAPEVARVACLPATEEGEAGGVRLLVVPSAAANADGRLRFEQLVPAEETLARIGEALDERRCVGARVVVEPPRYQGITVVARLRASPRASASRLVETALTALYRYFNPVIGGPDRTGWPFGRPVHVGEVYGVLQRLTGCEFVEDARLFGADPLTGQRGEATQRIDLSAGSLVFSYEHQVRAEEGWE
ncbi:MAG: putative baseplate assembly protein [Acidimicrobiales bacterium]